MDMTHYTPEDLINMANELHLDMHDSALPHILARHIYTLRGATQDGGSPGDYQTILVHMLKSLK
ncbi:hypothetical protein KKI90_11330 [Xenorhabdus bovienii]|uniref:Uncharacterized protein n=1 Tax=Xenorhabdus bovienii TaxID=40576 RepID=A0AAJ1JAP3_XENBV|nr:hypothetical protein [Xenorhabdus bovienii]MDE1480260.1 hypothetical protein [Xenorhabdus bovienii]MDE1486952.1 hypothetical protein [Xenorhabdus bovienii]MDE1495660.1 hypothetical protein [Xenorhabdus bovienii]MDE9477794.1 hypothetical protein [Xenorhabdus bovienii]MDE9511930.1 hypothetical protein [Xenorhabdus bovienii]